MANEAVILELFGQPSGEPIRFSVVDSVGLEKGTIMRMSGADLYAEASAANGDLFAGIVATEKVASDGSTTLGLYTKGIFDLKSDTGTITMGECVKISGANLIAQIETGEEVKTLGVALEASAANEVIRVAVGVY
jgi:hypothetical protein